MPKIEEIYWRAECSFAESHKHGLLAAEIHVSWAEAVGIVCALFGQVRRQIHDGDLSKIPASVLQRWCHSRKVTLDALKASGWVDADGRVHGWEERYGELAMKREAARERQRDHRARTKGGDVTQMSRSMSHDVTPVTSLHAIAREGEGEGYTSSLRSDVRGSAAFPPDVERLWSIYREATGRKPAPLTAKAAARIAEMLGWAGSFEAAERGVRKVGASAFHRGENRDRKRFDGLDDKPFRTADAFRGWCEEPISAAPPPPPPTAGDGSAAAPAHIGQRLLESVRRGGASS